MDCKEIRVDILSFKTVTDGLNKCRESEEKLFAELKKKYGLGEVIGNRDALVSAMKEKLAEEYCQREEP